MPSRSGRPASRLAIGRLPSSSLSTSAANPARGLRPPPSLAPRNSWRERHGTRFGSSLYRATGPDPPAIAEPPRTDSSEIGRESTPGALSTTEYLKFAAGLHATPQRSDTCAASPRSPRICEPLLPCDDLQLAALVYVGRSSTACDIRLRSVRPRMRPSRLRQCCSLSAVQDGQRSALRRFECFRRRGGELAPRRPPDRLLRTLFRKLSPRLPFYLSVAAPAARLACLAYFLYSVMERVHGRTRPSNRATARRRLSLATARTGNLG